MLALFPGDASAERLPLRVLGLADGLAGDAILTLFEDSHGFLWVGTDSGLSRYDGLTTRNYDVRDGLPGPRINDVTETADGSIWVATASGLARLAAGRVSGGEVFEKVDLPGDDRGLEVLLASRDGSLWIGGPELWRLDPASPHAGVHENLSLPLVRPDVGDLAEDAQGNLWMAAAGGLTLRRGDGSIHRFDVGGPNVGARSLVVDGCSRLWIGGPGGLFVLPVAALLREAESAAPDEDGRTLFARSRPPRFPGELPTGPDEVLFYSSASGLADDFIYSLALAGAAHDGVWVATRGGVTRLLDGTAWSIGTAQGLPEAAQITVLEDRRGTVWLGSESSGVSRLTDSGFVAFGEDDGLLGDRAVSLFDGPGGELYTVTWSRELHVFDGRRFEAVTPPGLFPDHEAGWGWNQFAFFDRRGALWFPANGVLSRFPPVATPGALRAARPERQWTPADGLPGGDIFRLYEDRLGNVWVSLIEVPPLVVLISGERLEPVPEVAADGILRGAPTAFAEDAEGGLWVGFYLGGLARMRNGQWQFYGAAEGVPAGFVSDLYLDRSHRLWVATTLGGVARVDRPEAPSPTFRTYTTADGLSTNSTRCLVEDRHGRLYVGTSRGVDLLDLERGSVRSFTTDDGLPNNLVRACHAATDGSLWFGTLHGLARFEPPPVEEPKAPEALITAITVAGRPQPIPELGTDEVSGLSTLPYDASLRIDFTGIAPAAGRDLAFQHRMAESSDSWSVASTSTSVEYPRLAAGRYRFEVRVVTATGATSAPAIAGFRVEPPLWRRPWFGAAIASALFLALLLALRIRAAGLLEVERARARIAADLHDDVGASVSRIGLLGELARQRLPPAVAEIDEMLAAIGSEARALADVTSDIVWAVDPERDDLDSLCVRLRRLAVDLFESCGIELDFRSPQDAGAIRLAPELRRAFFLCLKESIHNVAKHSQARHARVTIGCTSAHLEGEVADDGVGIAPERIAEALAEGRRGLPGLRRRAGMVGGSVRLEPSEERGLRVLITLPLVGGARGRSPHDHASDGDPAS